MLCVGVPAAFAAGPETTATPSPVTTVIDSPVTLPTLLLRHARAQALAAYGDARHEARLAGVHVRSPREILRTRSIAYLGYLRQVWIDRGARYRRLAHIAARNSAATLIALSQVGKPYVYGASSPRVGFDCSGLVMWAYGRVGVRLPHSSQAMMHVGRRVARNAIRRGDLVISNGGGHVGIYLGNRLVIDAPHTGAVVSRSPLAWWSITMIRRIT
jgi:cell wall-associated NlpC family hydrolase